MKFFQRDPWYQKLVQRSIQTFLPRRKTSSLRSRLLVVTGIGALLVSGLTFAIGGVGAIVWPNAPAGEATGGTIMTYFHNAFGDPATGTGKSCSGSGLITGFKTDGTPRCISIPDLTTLLGGSVASTTPTLTFTAPAVVMNGSGATLNWNTTNVSSCTKSGDWSGNLPGNQVNQSFTTPALTSTKTYSIDCVGTNPSNHATGAVTINTSTLSLTTSSTSITSGQSPTLTWSATNMVSCTKSWRASTDTSTSGTSTVSPTVTTNYTLTCTNSEGGIATQSVNISVAGSPTLTFTATNIAIMSDNPATLNWNTTNVSSCTKSLDWSGDLIGNQVNQSFTTPALTSNKSYKLTCSNTAGTSVEQIVNITVTAPTTPTILMPTPSPSTVNAGSPVTISWNATPATSCTTTGPSSDTSTWAATGLSGSGSRTFTPTVSGNYTVTCYNGSVSSSQSVNITVNAASTSTTSTATPENCFTFNAPTGTITAYSSTCPKNVVIPSTISGTTVTTIGFKAFYAVKITSVTIPNSVTMIQGRAFAANDLTSIIIPDSVTNIVDGAFVANLLTSVTIPNSVTMIGGDAFHGNQIASVTIPNSVTTIGQDAFSANELTSLTIPNSLTTIEIGAFSNNKLTSVVIPNSVTSIKSGAFNNNNLPPEQAFIYAVEDHTKIVSYGGAERSNVVIPNGVTKIGNHAFYQIGIAGVTIPNSVTSIEEGAFEGNNLTSVTIPNSVTSIERYTFQRNKLTSVTISNSVTNIASQSFQNNNLTSITIPNSVTSIEGGAFAGNNLTLITIPNSVTSIGNYAFAAQWESDDGIIDGPSSGYVKNTYDTNSGKQFDKIGLPNYITSTPENCFTFDSSTETITAYSGICSKDVVIPYTINGFVVTKIGTSAFSSRALTSAVIPKNVTSIGNTAFFNNALTSVIIPKNVTSIGAAAFGSNNLTSVTIPNSVISIGVNAFNFNQLTAVTIPDSVTSIGAYAFGNQNPISSGRVYGPSSGYVKDTYNLNSDNQFDKFRLPNYTNQ